MAALNSQALQRQCQWYKWKIIVNQSIRKFLLLCLTVLNLAVLSNVEADSSWIPSQPSGQSYQGYLDAIGAPNIDSIKTKCKKKRCTSKLNIGDFTHELPSKSANIIAASRYKDRAWVAVRYNQSECIDENNCSETHIFGSNGTHTIISKGYFCSSDENSNMVTYDGILQCINGGSIFRLYENEMNISSLPAKAIVGHFGHNPNGIWTAAFISEDSYDLYMGKGTEWVKASTDLNASSRFKNILNSYPVSDKSSFVVLEQYVNSINKSIEIFSVQNGEFEQKTLLNSTHANIPGKPEIYSDKENTLHVKLQNRKNDDDEFYSVNALNFEKGVKYRSPYTYEDYFIISIGAGLSVQDWSASHSSQTSIGEDYFGLRDTEATTEYDVNKEVMRTIQLESQVGSAQIGFNLARPVNQENEDVDAYRAFRYASYFAMNTGESMWVAEFEMAKYVGSATVDSDISDEEKFDFESYYRSISILSGKVEGNYLGLNVDYFQAPVATVDVDELSHTIYSAYSENASLMRLLFVIGYDARNYNRKMNYNYKGLYGSFRLGAGLAFLDAGETTAAAPAIDLKTQFGYEYRLRFVEARGLGASLKVGMDLHWNLASTHIVDVWDIFGGSSDQDDSEVDSEMHRLDTRYGPFVRLNMVF